VDPPAIDHNLGITKHQQQSKMQKAKCKMRHSRFFILPF
jgi:hypothetical protein